MVNAARDDEVKLAILEFLHKKRSTAKSVNDARVGIMEIRKALKQKGMSQEEVVTNLLYLIESNWVKQIIQQKHIANQKGFFPKPSEKYMITNEGMELFDEKSKFRKKDVFAGINVHNLNGVVNIGDNNLIQNEHVELFKTLDELEAQIRMTGQLSDEQKVHYSGEIKTIQSQLWKPHPDNTTVMSSWDKIKQVGSIASLAASVSSIGLLIAKVTGLTP